MLSDYLTANSIFVAVIGLILLARITGIVFHGADYAPLRFRDSPVPSKWRSSSDDCQVRMRYGSGD